MESFERISKKFNAQNAPYGRYYIEGVMEEFQLGLIEFDNKSR